MKIIIIVTGSYFDDENQDSEISEYPLEGELVEYPYDMACVLSLRLSL